MAPGFCLLLSSLWVQPNSADVFGFNFKFGTAQLFFFWGGGVAVGITRCVLSKSNKLLPWDKVGLLTRLSVFVPSP